MPGCNQLLGPRLMQPGTATPACTGEGASSMSMPSSSRACASTADSLVRDSLTATCCTQHFFSRQQGGRTHDWQVNRKHVEAS